MAELNARDTKLVQYLNEALTKEKQLEQALQAHIEMTTWRRTASGSNSTSARRSVTRARSSAASRSSAERPRASRGVVHDAAGVVQDVAAKGAAIAQGPVHMVRGTSEQEVLLKNARTEFKEEAEEIASYTAIQNLAETVGDKDTAQLAKAILREEKRMAGFLEKLIPRLTKSVVQAEIPRSERNGGRRRTTSRRTTASSSRSAQHRVPEHGAAEHGTKRTTAKRTTAKRTTAKRTTASRSRSASARSRGTARSGSGSSSSSARRTTSGRASGGRKTTRRTTARSR